MVKLQEEVAGLHRYASQGGEFVVTGTADKQLDSLHEATRLPIVLRSSILAARKRVAASDPASEPDLLKAMRPSTGVEDEGVKKRRCA